MCVSETVLSYASADCEGFSFPAKVYKDFRILTKLESLHIAPAPLFRSLDAEEKIIGTAFIAMTWVEVKEARPAECCGAIMCANVPTHIPVPLGILCHSMWEVAVTCCRHLWCCNVQYSLKLEQICGKCYVHM